MGKTYTFEQAIELLRENYVRILATRWERNPISVAFYETWKELDGDKK